MKPNEINKPTLQQVCSMSWVVSLNEVFDTKFTDITWNTNGLGAQGYARLRDEDFVISLQPGTWKLNDIEYTFINCSFEKVVGGQPTTDLQFNSSNASAIIGAVSNAIAEQLQRYQVDAVVFADTDHIKDRMRIYNVIAQAKMIPGFHRTIRDIPTIRGKMTVTVNNNIPNDNINDFIHYLKTVEK